MRAWLDFMVKGLAACAAAFQFLTRLPVPVTLHYDDAMFRRSVVFYPLVGAVLGLLLGLGGLLLQTFLTPAAAAALMLLLWVAMTGALHLDGLMDTADGILSHRPREQMLEIMKDSRVGAMGVVACVLLLLCKWTLLQQWLPLSGSKLLLLPLVTLWSRWFMVVAIAAWPYARKGASGEAKGLGAFFRGLGWRHLGIHTVLALLLSILLITASGASLLSLQGLAILSVAAGGSIVIGWCLSAYMHHKLGGLTGDTYGALNEVIEASLLLCVYTVL